VLRLRPRKLLRPKKRPAPTSEAVAVVLLLDVAMLAISLVVTNSRPPATKLVWMISVVLKVLPTEHQAETSLWVLLPCYRLAAIVEGVWDLVVSLALAARTLPLLHELAPLLPERTPLTLMHSGKFVLHCK
jgi:hypothetical protein